MYAYSMFLYSVSVCFCTPLILLSTFLSLYSSEISFLQVMRLQPVVAGGMVRQVPKDIEHEGFTIPRGATANIHYMRSASVVTVMITMD
jgi:hypothetical protein